MHRAFLFFEKLGFRIFTEHRSARLQALGAPGAILGHAGWPCQGSVSQGGCPRMWLLRATCWQSLGCANVLQLEADTDPPSRTGLGAIPIRGSLRGCAMGALPLSPATP